MQINGHLHSTLFASAYSRVEPSAVLDMARLSPVPNAETAGNSRFPAVSEPEKSERSSSSGDSQGEASSKASEQRAASEAERQEGRERQEKLSIERERRQIVELAARDREVRAHEQAHMAVGGRYAGSASYQYERGPDGVSYAISGEVPISTSREATPQATIIKAQIIRRAALAPAEPSPQDRQVAARASAIEAEARKELVIENQRDQSEKAASAKENDEKSAGKAERQNDDTKPVEASRTESAKRFDMDLGGLITSLNPGLPGSANGRLQQSISNSALGALQAGSILDQIA